MKEIREYKQTELGLLPEGWEVAKLGDIGYFLKGGIITATRKSGKDFRVAVYLSDSFSVYESVSEWFILQ